jgi:hypothetical protein
MVKQAPHSEIQDGGSHDLENEYWQKLSKLLTHLHETVSKCLS